MVKGRSNGVRTSLRWPSDYIGPEVKAAELEKSIPIAADDFKAPRLIAADNIYKKRRLSREEVDTAARKYGLDSTDLNDRKTTATRQQKDLEAKWREQASARSRSHDVARAPPMPPGLLPHDITALRIPPPPTATPLASRETVFPFDSQKIPPLWVQLYDELRSVPHPVMKSKSVSPYTNIQALVRLNQAFPPLDSTEAAAALVAAANSEKFHFPNSKEMVRKEKSCLWTPSQELHDRHSSGAHDIIVCIRTATTSSIGNLFRNSGSGPGSAR